MTAPEEPLKLCMSCRWFPCTHDDSSWCTIDCIPPHKLRKRLAKSETEVWEYLANNIRLVGETVTPAKGRSYPTSLVHRLVCEAFYGEAPTTAHQVRHLDGDPANNAPENLDWCLPSENWTDRNHDGNGVREKHWAAKLNGRKVDDIRTKRLSTRAFARLYEVSQATICGVQSGVVWKEPASATPCSPRWASRITLEITSVRVEKIKRISNIDAIAEGITSTDDPHLKNWRWLGADHPVKGVPMVFPTAAMAFSSKWERTYPGSWDRNDWVWVITFKKL